VFIGIELFTAIISEPRKTYSDHALRLRSGERSTSSRQLLLRRLPTVGAWSEAPNVGALPPAGQALRAVDHERKLLIYKAPFAFIIIMVTSALWILSLSTLEC